MWLLARRCDLFDVENSAPNHPHKSWFYMEPLIQETGKAVRISSLL